VTAGGRPGPAALEAVLARIPEWRGRRVAVQPLSAGMTNTNYRVDVDGRAYVVRIPGAATDVLGIDRENEHHNARVAAAVGVGPRVVRYLPDLGVIVTEFIDGRTLRVADLQEPGMPARLGAMLRRLHAGPSFLTGFDMFRLIDRYLALVDRRGLPLPVGYRRGLSTLRGIEARLAAGRPAVAPCHNDLLPENLIDDGERLRAVDYEYSGNGDPTFDLGNTCQELRYDDGRIDELCAAYFGSPSAAGRARVKLQMIVSDAGWALWAVVQSRISRIELDYWAYGRARWERAERTLASPELRDWLDALDAASRGERLNG
jgi:thiamine kinase-like enzyme